MEEPLVQAVVPHRPEIETIPRGIETTIIRLDIPYEFEGLKQYYILNEASVAKAANLSLRMAKDIIIEKCLKAVSKSFKLPGSSSNIFKRSFNEWCIYAADTKFITPAIIAYTKKKSAQPIYSFTEDNGSREFVLFYDDKPVPEITTRTEVELLNTELIKSLYVQAVNALKGSGVNILQAKYTLISPFMIKAILDSAGFGSVIPLSINQGFGFDNFDIILQKLEDIIAWIDGDRFEIDPALKNELLEFIIGIQLSIVYGLNSSDILGAVNALRILQNLHDTLPAVGVIDITKAGGGQRGYDNIVFVFSIILENMFTGTISYGSKPFKFFEYIEIIKEKVFKKLEQSIIGVINGKNLKEIIRVYLFEQTATDNISNIVTIFTIVTEIVKYFLSEEGNKSLNFFLDEISSLYDPIIREFTIATCEEFTMLGFQMQKWYQVKRFWPQEFKLPDTSDLAESGIHFDRKTHFTDLINEFKKIYRRQLPAFVEELQISTFKIFLYEAACGHDLLSQLITSWLIELYPDILNWVKDYENTTSSGYAWDAIHSQVIKKIQQETRCQICLASFEVTQIHGLSGISGKYTLWGLNSSLCANSQVTKEIANITASFREKLANITIKTPRGEPAPSAYPGIPIPIDNLVLSSQILVVDLQKYLSAIQRETINAQRMSQLQGISDASVSAEPTNLDVEITEVTSAMNYGFERKLALKAVSQQPKVVQVLPVVTRCDEASGVECPRAYYQFGSQLYILERADKYKAVKITFSVTQTHPDYQDGLFMLASTDHTTSIQDALASVRDEELKELLIFLKQNILYKSYAIGEIAGKDAVTGNIETDYDRMCANIATYISQPDQKENLFKLIKLGLFNPNHEEKKLEFIVITPESIDNLVSFLFMNGKQNLITYILNFIREQLEIENKKQVQALSVLALGATSSSRPIRGVSQKKEMQNDPQKVIEKIQNFLDIFERINNQRPIGNNELFLSDFCMLNACLKVLETAKETGILCCEVVKGGGGKINYVTPEPTKIATMGIQALEAMNEEDRAIFTSKLVKICAGKISNLASIREESPDTRKQEIDREQQEITRQQQEIARQQQEIARQQQELAMQQQELAMQKRAYEKVIQEISSRMNPEEAKKFDVNIQYQNDQLLQELALSSANCGGGCPLESPSDSAKEVSSFAGNKRRKIEDNKQSDGPEIGSEIILAIEEAIEQEAVNLKLLIGQKRSNDDNENPVDENPVDENPDYKKQKSGEQNGGSRELQTGDIIFVNQLPDGTIEYMHFLNYFFSVFGINEKEENSIVIEPATSDVSTTSDRTSLGFPKPPRPVPHNVGDIVSEEEAKTLKKNRQFDYKQKIDETGKIQYELIQYTQPVTEVVTLADLPKETQGVGLGNQELVYNTPTAYTAGRPTRRHKIKTSKRKTRKHRKIKYKKYTRPYKPTHGKKSRKGRNKK